MAIQSVAMRAEWSDAGAGPESESTIVVQRSAWFHGGSNSTRESHFLYAVESGKLHKALELASHKELAVAIIASQSGMP